ncbi:hypothetical protein PTTG_12367 [Puccinia triticina 1-1 BBBD Race 1]|uniref:Uncharacterized protein n=2 Tax=Puccinia triticina TaxID=208348 RepID=A0A180GUV9_PUCT1|nr:uncharacterized protein PtA15_3A167 [Puccinia triticina]OAV96304.1 hypothetical protein PTTG_12367 [Puccinia triticina 1-1 BBBD Race 1]WAQ82803.1 hypothetical protein PtA15_3A167 [Puccinia triticina]WAR53644.1 hypothetical protein PtB15_3B152 [Puccinia triticina]
MSLKISGHRHSYARNRLLNFYIGSLLSRPLLTKSCTSATLSFLQEVLASKLADERPTVVSSGYKPLDYAQSLGVSVRAIKLTAYGGLISAPLSHGLMKLLHRVFPNHESSDKSKLGMILASMLITGPIQNSVYLIAMGAIEGLKSQKEIYFFWKNTIGILTKMSIILGTLSTIIANRFLSKELWVPFFNLVGFVLGTYVNFLNKKKQKGAAKDKKDPNPTSSIHHSKTAFNETIDDHKQRK